jgi:CDP-diacylglycerol--glycerol-3-phosphate 3-phosphatidyltransferase
MASLSDNRKLIAYHITRPLVGLLARTPITPNILTWLGFMITLGAAVLIATGHFIAAGILVLFSGFFDMLDGALARHTDKTTPFGAILDSTLDRLSEAVLLLGIVTLCLLQERPAIEIILAFLVLISSLMVSYVRARAEASDMECQVGLLTRGERVPLLALGLLFNQLDYALTIALSIIAVFSFITIGQRVFHIWRQTRTG